MLELDKVHDYVVGKQGEAKIVRVRPAIRFAQAGEVTIFCQDGKFWYESDETEIAFDDLPSWVTKQLERLSADARREAGIETPDDYEPAKGKLQVAKRKASVQKKNAPAEDSGDDEAPAED